MRSFRYYGKKRGHRRTGSPALASMGEAVFSGVFLLLGCCGLVWMLADYVVPEWRVNHEFVETTCRVLDKQIGEKDFGEDGLLYRPEIKIRYEVGGVVYQDPHYDISYYRRTGRLLRAGGRTRRPFSTASNSTRANHKTYPCWYDPANPSVAVLVRGYGWVRWLVFTVPLSFIIIGAGGLIHVLLHWGKSAERQALIAQRGRARAGFFRRRRRRAGGIPPSRRAPT